MQQLANLVDHTLYGVTTLQTGPQQSPDSSQSVLTVVFTVASHVTRALTTYKGWNVHPESMDSQHYWRQHTWIQGVVSNNTADCPGPIRKGFDNVSLVLDCHRASSCST